jgi:predicted phosphoadenosine phosphosulfate sulfurtransferase
VSTIKRALSILAQYQRELAKLESEIRIPNYKEAVKLVKKIQAYRITWGNSAGFDHPGYRECERRFQELAKPILDRPTMRQMGLLRSLGYEGGAFDITKEQARQMIADMRGETPNLHRPQGRRCTFFDDDKVVKRPIGCTVLEAARLRIAEVFDRFERVYVSFSGGKDSSTMLHLVMEEAIKRNRKIGVLFVDLEAQYRLTIEHVEAMYSLYEEHIEPFWIALPLHLRNAVSQYEPHWICWEPGRESDWVRKPSRMAIVDESLFPFFRRGMEFEEFVEEFGHWYGGGALTACMVGIRADESLNRFRTLAAAKGNFEGRQWTTHLGSFLYNAYPIYDWRTEDIWTYAGKTGKAYNRLYDLMHKAGLTIHQQRICQPYGDDQRRGLWLYHIIEPETWARVVARVNGANSGALYVRESGNILGIGKITCPEGHTWQSFAKLLLGSMPEKTAEHYRNKILVFLKWWADRGYPDGIPDEMPTRLESGVDGTRRPSWRRICKVLLRNDYWCKGLSFTQTKSDAYDRYKSIMEKRRERWGINV